MGERRQSFMHLPNGSSPTPILKPTHTPASLTISVARTTQDSSLNSDTQAYRSTSFASGPSGSSEAAKLHCHQQGVRRSSTHLVEHSQLVRLERADNRVQESPVVEEDQIPFVPVLRVDELP
jgi:hypothetical protein